MGSSYLILAKEGKEKKCTAEILYKALGCKDILKPSKPGHVGIHWIALAEHFKVSTHVPGF